MNKSHQEADERDRFTQQVSFRDPVPSQRGKYSQAHTKKNLTTSKTFRLVWINQCHSADVRKQTITKLSESCKYTQQK